MTDYTANLRLTLVDYDSFGWDEAVNQNFKTLDFAVTQKISNLQVKGVWLNSTYYVPGYTVYDPANGTFWTALSYFTSMAAPATFTQERAANPLLWANVSFAPINLGSFEAIIRLLPTSQPSSGLWLNDGFLCFAG